MKPFGKKEFAKYLNKNEIIVGLTQCSSCSKFQMGVTSYYTEIGKHKALCLEHYHNFLKAKKEKNGR